MRPTPKKVIALALEHLSNNSEKVASGAIIIYNMLVTRLSSLVLYRSIIQLWWAFLYFHLSLFDWWRLNLKLIQVNLFDYWTFDVWMRSSFIGCAVKNRVQFKYFRLVQHDVGDSQMSPFVWRFNSRRTTAAVFLMSHWKYLKLMEI